MINIFYNLQHQSVRFLICALMMTSATFAYAQDNADDQVAEQEQAPERKPRKAVKTAKQYPTVTLHGNVIDLGTKAPLAGVQIQALGNNRYTAMTDEEGNFTIKIPKFVTSLYVFTPEYLSQQVAVNPTDSVSNIAIKMLSDRFVKMYDTSTNYTASKKIEIDSHYATIDGDIVKELNGELHATTRSGMVENGAAMFIRGLNSINANAQPLIILDGIEQDLMLDRPSLHEGQFMNVLSNIAPGDIESIEVLKNATALYGSRGGNGVILINTKRGHSMATRIDANVYAGVQLIPSMPTMMNSQQYRTYATEMIGTIDAVKNYNGTLKFNFLNDDPTNYYYHTYHNNTDWTDDIYRKAITQNYSVNVQGGDAVGMYNLSLGYMKAQNTIKDNDFDRFNIRFNTDIEIIPILTTQFNLSISRTTSQLLDTSIPANLSQGTITSPNFLSLIKSPIVSPYTYNANAGVYSDVLYGADDIFSELDKAQSGLGTAQSLANPVSILKYGSGENKNYAENTNFNIFLAPTLKINKHLKLTEEISYTLIRNSQRYFRPQTGMPDFTISDLGTVSSKVASFQATENNIVSNTRLNWENTFNGSHFVRLYGGFRYNKFDYNGTKLTTEYKKGQAPDDKNPSLTADETKGYSSTEGYADVWKQLQWYANADYNYQNRYFLTLSALAEANSRFGKNAGKKMFGVGWAIFPSVQLGWVLTNEKWFRKNKGVNYLRINAGFDTSGNDNISNYAARTSFTSVRYNYKAIGTQLTNIGNDKIKWELTKKYNVGIEGNFIDNRISLAFNYYYHKTSDLLTLKTFDSPISGINTYWTNGGELTNKGFEFAFSGKPVVTKNWRVELGATVGHYTNKVTSLPDGDYTSSIYGDNNILTAVGMPVGVFYGYQTDGIFTTSAEAASAGKSHVNSQGNTTTNLYMVNAAGQKIDFEGGDVRFVDQNNDGVISEADKVVIGDPNPDFYGNIFASINWKRLTLGLNFTYSIGNDIYNYKRSVLNSGSNFYNQQIAEANHWRYEGQQTSSPRVNYADPLGNNRFSDRWIEDGSYLRLKAINLTYQVPVPSSWSWLQGLSIWAEARNLFTLTRYKGDDPEFSIGNGVLYQGIDAGNLTQGRSFLVGVKINL